METLLSAAITLSSFLVMLTILVFVHEWGHFIVARLNGIKVDVFSIGFGPELWGRTDAKGTRWKISLIPLGGYVKFFGDATAASTPDAQGLEELSEEDKKQAFHFKKLYQRAAVVFAGPLANFIFAILIIATFFYLHGQVNTPAFVSEVAQGGAADRSGIIPGDQIVGVDGQEIKRFKDLQTQVFYSAGETMTVAVLRDGEILSLVVTPELKDYVVNGEKIKDQNGEQVMLPQIGITNAEKVVIIEHGIGSALWAGVIETRVIVKQSLRGIRQIIVGSRSVEDLSGPIGIALIAGESAKRGLDYWIQMIALISISLGMINLFPIPLLDGGHLLFYAFEAVLGKPLSQNIQEFGFRVGLVFVLGLMIFVTMNDILKFNW